MRKTLCLILAALLFLTGCTATPNISANTVMAKVREHRELLIQCAEEMQKFGLERVYVAIEFPKEEKDKNEKAPSVTTEAPVARLVSFEKESDDRTEIKNPILQEAIETLGLELIFFQTASDSRQTVIFSYTREADSGVQQGFYYSYDAMPAGWWGRKAELERKDQRWLQMNQKGDAWYYTVQIEDHFYYFEKNGYLLG
ncbi:MAG: hypothetical protein IKJ74_07890 [Clostridia bacterium]|nr:hypothetical protein [Clostridia bacterium]